MRVKPYHGYYVVQFDYKGYEISCINERRPECVVFEKDNRILFTSYGDDAVNIRECMNFIDLMKIIPQITGA